MDHRKEYTETIMKQFLEATETESKTIDFAIECEGKTRYVYFRVHNIDSELSYEDETAKIIVGSEWKNGEFIGRMSFPFSNNKTECFPSIPPLFKFLTPNGFYAIGTENICVNEGKYHKKDYKFGGVGPFIAYLVAGMLNWRDAGEGISLLQTTVAEKIKLSNGSKAYNIKHNDEILKKIASQQPAIVKRRAIQKAKKEAADKKISAELDSKMAKLVINTQNHVDDANNGKSEKIDKNDDGKQ